MKYSISYSIFFLVIPLSYHSSSFHAIHFLLTRSRFTSIFFLIISITTSTSTTSTSTTFFLMTFFVFFAFFSALTSGIISSLSEFRMFFIHLFEKLSFKTIAYRFKMHIVAKSTSFAGSLIL